MFAPPPQRAANGSGCVDKILSVERCRTRNESTTEHEWQFVYLYNIDVNLRRFLQDIPRNRHRSHADPNIEYRNSE